MITFICFVRVVVLAFVICFCWVCCLWVLIGLCVLDGASENRVPFVVVERSGASVVRGGIVVRGLAAPILGV